MAPLRIALAQINVTVGDLPGNAARIAEAIRHAEAWRADLVLLPELAVTGYPPEDLLLKPRFVDDALRTLQALARGVSGVTAVVGALDRDRQGRLYNAAAVLAQGRVAAVYHKQCLPNYGVFDEQRYFTPGTRSVVIEVAGVPCALSICEDLWMELPAAAAAAQGAQLLCAISASPYHAGKLAQRERLFAARAQANRLAVAYCNLVGGQDELVFDGGSLVLNARGRLLARGRQCAEDLVVYDLEPQALGPVRRVQPAAWLPGPPGRRPAYRPPLQARSARLPEIYEALTLGLRDYVRKNGFASVVLGLSGGIDSALVACLAVDALGARQVKALVMPSRFNAATSQQDARAVGRALAVEVFDVSIEPLFRAALATLKPLFRGRPFDVTEQNLQARLRGLLLMAFSNKFGWMALTTGNKSEIATGYCTLYGDMVGGFAVIKDVPKMLVYELARYRNQQGPGRPIPARVLRRRPSAELAPHQTDQDTLPPYPVLDRILTGYVEQDRSAEELLRRGLPSGTVRRVARMVDQAEYKRRQGAPGVKITPKAFGRDRRMPITNRYQDA